MSDLTKKKIIVALDVQSKEELHFLTTELKEEASFVKVGMELYYTFGNDIIKKLKDLNFKVFLDLKLHDIPNTVYSSCKTLGHLGVDILNVHAAGGIEMMSSALEGFREHNSSGLLIGVTQLTSTSQQQLNTELKIPGKMEQIVLSYAQNVKNAGLDGVVCSAHEVKLLKENLGQNFKCITPGIRPKNTAANDQKRVMTPIDAINAGSDFLVIGRAITNEKSPKLAFQKIVQDMLAAK